MAKRVSKIRIDVSIKAEGGIRRYAINTLIQAIDAWVAWNKEAHKDNVEIDYTATDVTEEKNKKS